MIADPLRLAQRAAYGSKVRPTLMQDKDDLVQEAWILANRSQHLAQDDDHLSAMVARVLSLRRFDIQEKEERNRSREQYVARSGPGVSACDPEPLVVHQEEFLKLTRFLSRKDRRFLQLIAFSGLSKQKAAAKVYSNYCYRYVYEVISRRIRPAVQRALSCRS